MKELLLIGMLLAPSAIDVDMLRRDLIRVEYDKGEVAESQNIELNKRRNIKEITVIVKYHYGNNNHHRTLKIRTRHKTIDFVLRRVYRQLKDKRIYGGRDLRGRKSYDEGEFYVDGIDFESDSKNVNPSALREMLGYIKHHVNSMRKFNAGLLNLAERSI